MVSWFVNVATYSTWCASEKTVAITLSADGIVFAFFGVGMPFCSPLFWVAFGLRNVEEDPCLINGCKLIQKLGWIAHIQSVETFFNVVSGQMSANAASI